MIGHRHLTPSQSRLAAPSRPDSPSSRRGFERLPAPGVGTGQATDEGAPLSMTTVPECGESDVAGRSWVPVGESVRTTAESATATATATDWVGAAHLGRQSSDVCPDIPSHAITQTMSTVIFDTLNETVEPDDEETDSGPPLLAYLLMLVTGALVLLSGAIIGGLIVALEGGMI